MHSIKEDSDVLLDLLVAHQVLEVSIGVVRFLHFIELLHLLLKLVLARRVLFVCARRERFGRLHWLLARLVLLAHHQFLVDDAHLRSLKVQHEHPVQTQNSLGVLLQVDQVVLRHELASDD